VNKIGKLKAIVACSPEGIIAANGDMPWHVSEDLRRFKRLTVNNVVIYGRGTWVSFNKKALPDRINFMVSTTTGFSDIANTTVVNYHDLDAAISCGQIKYPDKDLWIIGGASIYRQTLPIVDELYLTIINPEQVRYGEIEDDNVLYLPGYPNFINKTFTLDTEEVTQCATYRKYIRKTTDFRNPTRSTFAQAKTKSIKDFSPNYIV